MIFAHGVGARADLPLPAWLFAYSASFALLISFVALRILWPSPRLAAKAGGRALSGTVGRALDALVRLVQILVLGLFVLTVGAALFGPDSVSENLAPTAVYIAFWVGVQVISALAGDLWRWANPLWLIAASLDRFRGRDTNRNVALGWFASHWPAAAGLFVFQWMELAFHEPASVSAIAAFLVVYCSIVVVGGARFGAGWVREGDGFAVLFSLLGRLSPLARDEAGAWRLRLPASGLASLTVRPGTIAVVLVVLGGTTFDGVSRTRWWGDVVGVRRDWDRTAVMTVGLVLTIGVVAAGYHLATRLVGVLADDPGGHPERWVHSLVPIVLAYSVAHYFSLLVFEGQSFIALLSDPFGRGWDVLGTASNRIDYSVVSPNQIAYVQVGAIVIGHVAGVVLAHDRAVERYDHRRAVRSQYPMLAVMVAYTTAGLLLLLNA